MRTYKRVDVKIFAEGHRAEDAKTLRWIAPRGQEFTPEGVDGLLLDVVEQLAEQFPAYKFKVVPVGRGRFNVVHNVGQA